MQHTIKTQLDEILLAHERKAAEREAVTAPLRGTAEAFLATFSQLARGVIRPVLEEFGAVIVSSGHDFSIRETRSTFDALGVPGPASISLALYPTSITRASFVLDNSPSLAFVAQPASEMVNVVTAISTPLAPGPTDEASLKLTAVTAEQVEAELLAFLKAVLA